MPHEEYIPLNKLSGQPDHQVQTTGHCRMHMEVAVGPATQRAFSFLPPLSGLDVTGSDGNFNVF